MRPTRTARRAGRCSTRSCVTVQGRCLRLRRQAEVAALQLARHQGATLFELRAALDDFELRGQPTTPPSPMPSAASHHQRLAGTRAGPGDYCSEPTAHRVAILRAGTASLSAMAEARQLITWIDQPGHARPTPPDEAGIRIVGISDVARDHHRRPENAVPSRQSGNRLSRGTAHHHPSSDLLPTRCVQWQYRSAIASNHRT